MLIVSITEIKERKNLEERLRNEIYVEIKVLGSLYNFHWKLMQTLTENVKVKDLLSEDWFMIPSQEMNFWLKNPNFLNKWKISKMSWKKLLTKKQKKKNNTE